MCFWEGSRRAAHPAMALHFESNQVLMRAVSLPASQALKLHSKLKCKLLFFFFGGRIYCGGIAKAFSPAVSTADSTMLVKLWHRLNREVWVPRPCRQPCQAGGL